MTENPMFASVAKDGSSTMGAMTQLFRINTDGSYEIVRYSPTDDSLKIMQEIVGGLIEPVDLSKLDMTLWANEEGLLMQLPVNTIATALVAWAWAPAQVIPMLGDVFLSHVTTDAEGEMIGLDNETIEKMIKLMKDEPLDE